MTASRTPLSLERLKHLLSYDPETGVFTRLVTTSPRALAGTVAACRSHDYLVVQIDRRKYLQHRLAVFYMTGKWPQGDIDHVNHVGTDNRWKKIRDVTTSVNLQNQVKAQSHNKSCGLLGASWDKRHGYWTASIKVNRKSLHIGCFNTAQAAHEAYVAKKRELHPGNTL